MNSGVWVKGAYNQHESDYYGELENIYEIKFAGGVCENSVVLFKCRWFDPVNGVKVDKHGLVELKKKVYGCLDDPYVLSSQCHQVFYLPYPSTSRNLKDLWAVVKSTPRSVYEVSQTSSAEQEEDELEDENFFQEHDRMRSQPSELIPDFCLADRGIAEEVNVDNANIEDNGDSSDGEKEFEEDDEDEEDEEEEFEDDDDESNENELHLSDHSSDE